MKFSKPVARAAALLSALMLTLAALAGCAAPASSAVSSSVSSSQSTPVEQPPRDLPEFNDPRVVNTAYTRENCLALAPFPDGYSITYEAKLYAEKFVLDNYAACKPTVTAAKYVRGGYVQAATLGYSTEIYLSTTEIHFTCEDAAAGSADLLPADGDGYLLYLQRISARVDGGWQLLGFCTRQSGDISTQAELARFLQLEPTYLDGYPASERLTALNLTVQYGLDNVCFAAAFDPSHIAVAYFTTPMKSYENESPEYAWSVAFIDLEAKQITATAALADAESVSELFVENGELTAVFRTDQNSEQLKAARYAADGSALGVADYSEDNSFALTPTLTVYNDGVSIKVDNNGKKKTLFKGNSSQTVEDWHAYRVVCTLDEHRFIYAENGYDWIIGCYIYDFDTGDSKPLELEEDEPRYPMASYGSLALLSPLNEPSYGTVYLADFSGGNPVARTICEGERCYIIWASFSPDGSRLMLRHVREDENAIALSMDIEVYDAASGALLLRIDDSAPGQSQDEPVFINDAFGFVLPKMHFCCDSVIYLLDLS